LTASDLPESLREVRAAIERAVPHGISFRGRDKGSWGEAPSPAQGAWGELKPRFDAIVAKHPTIRQSNNLKQLGTLGTGNHLIEVCLDEADRLWLMLHSGSRGVGNKIGTYFIELAKDFAMTNRRLMMAAVMRAMRSAPGIPPFEAGTVAVNCHHNYVARERHYERDVLVTRKGAVRARAGDLGIIPGSMGARSYIVRGRGNPEAFDSCSHGAGRAMMPR